MKKLIIALVLISSTAQAEGINGRDLYYENPDMLATINADVAKEVHRKELPLPTVHLVKKDKLSPFGHVDKKKDGSIVMTLTYKARLYHVHHEMVHYYQYSYNLTGQEACKIVCGGTCKGALEIDAVLRSIHWCSSNNCPTTTIDTLESIAECGE